MSTERELLELAAKAAGYAIVGWDDRMPDVPIVRRHETEKGYHWMPLTDDGDALRLAVKLCMQVECSKGWQHASVYGHDFSIGEEIHSGANAGDPYAATRRAIVRAAAEIGRSTMSDTDAQRLAAEVKRLAAEFGEQCERHARVRTPASKAAALVNLHVAIDELAAQGEQPPQPPLSPPAERCTYPSCNCPFDAPADPNWCARGLPHAPKGEKP